MGVLVTIDGVPYEPQAYSVSEAGTPLASDDSTGAVGSFTVSVPMPRQAYEMFGLKGAVVTLADSRKGFTAGTVEGLTAIDENGIATFACISKLGVLNAYNVQAGPFIGTLADAIAYYFSLAGVTDGFKVDAAIASRSVVTAGWNGELWFNLKQFCAARSIEIALVSGFYVVRGIRSREAVRNRTRTAAVAMPGTQLARSIEIYLHDTRQITNQLVYPPGGWTDEVDIITVKAGETVEQILKLDASVSSIEQPEFRSEVTPGYSASSVFTVVGDDNRPITEAAWNARGGSLAVTINPDTKSLTVKIKAPTSIGSAEGVALKTYSIALSSGNRYSTLRIVGTGVAVKKTKYTFPTGVAASRTATEVGITIDNPHITSLNSLYTAAIRAIRRFSGRQITLSTSVVAINRIGDKGSVYLPLVGEVDAYFAGKTVAEMDADPINAGKTVGQISAYWATLTADDFDNQAFGNVGGARVWHDQSARWYRARTATFAPEGIQIEADDDLLVSDVRTHYAGRTVGDINALMAGLTVNEVTMRGLALV